MQKIKFVTDSASDISLTEEAHHPSLLVMNYKVTLGDLGFTSRIDMSDEDFYRSLSETEDIPTTAQLTSFEFYDVFESIYNDGYTHVIVTLINKEASATFSNAERAIGEFFVDHPDAKGRIVITLLDSRTYSGGYGHTVLSAVKMAEDGCSYDDIISFMRDDIEHRVIYFAPFTLKYAKKSGRIPGAVAVVGEALGIKPIMRIYDHKIVNSEMVRGDKKLPQKIAEKSFAEMDRGSEYCVVYGSEPVDGEHMADAMRALCGYGPIGFYRINPIVCSHSGPRVIGVIFRSK